MDVGLRHCLNECGLTTDAQRNKFTNQSGVTVLSDFVLFEESDLNKIASQLAKRPPAQRLNLTQIQIKKLYGLVLWVKDKTRRGQVIDPYQFTAAIIVDIIERSKFEAIEEEADNVKPPPNFQPINWVRWYLLLSNYLRSLRGVTGIPLYYVGREDKTPAEIQELDESEKLIYQAPLRGNAFKADNKKYYSILKQFLANTDAWQWIESYDDSQHGRNAVIALRTHYDGPGARLKRIAAANQSLENLHYNQEQTFSFEKYITVMQGAFNILRDNGEAKRETEKVRTLCKKITSTNVQLQSAISTVAMDDNLRNNFTDACNKLSERVAMIFPAVSGGRTTYRRNASAVRGGRGRGGRGRGPMHGRGRGRGGRHYRPYNNNRNELPKSINGVDTSDPLRSFTSDEYEKLPGWAKKRIYDLRNNNNRRPEYRRQAAATTNDLSVAVTRGIMAASTNNNETDNATDLTSDNAQQGQNNQQSNSNNISSGSSGNQASQVSFGRNAYRRSNRLSVMVSSLRSASSVKSNDHLYSDFSVNQVGYAEIDNHADTCCFGANFRPTFITDQVCEVSPYHESYESISNVPVVSACTAYDDPTSGQTYIINIHQGLWFGKTMKNSLISPNQIRSFGIPLCDDPYDPHRSLGMKVYTSNDESVNIPFELNGSFAVFKTRVPTDEEMTNYKQITLTSDHQWDPRNLQVKSISSTSPIPVHISESQPVIDSILSSISSHPRETMQAIVSKHERSLRSLHSVNTKPKRSRVDAEQLSKRWRISYNTAKNTLLASTQNNLRQPVHPITRRFRTDLSTLRYRRLNERWYSDTLFSKVKSLQGHTCAQIFNSKSFVKIVPMKSEKEAGRSLKTFNEDVGVPNHITVDGAKAQVSPNTDFAKQCSFTNTHIHRIEPYTPNQNFAETVIGWMKKRWRNQKRNKDIPNRLWDYSLMYETELFNLIARGNDKRTGYERVTGDTPDISEYLDYEFYDWVYYWDMPGDIDNPKIGRWLGISHRVGSALCYWILKENGQVISRTTVQPIQYDDMHKPETIQQLERFQSAINPILSDDNHIINNVQATFYLQDAYWYDEEAFEFVEPITPEVDDYEEETYDNLIGQELSLPAGGMLARAKIINRKRDQDGNLVGKRSNNHLANTAVYEVEFTSGEIREYMANTLVEAMMADCDEEGKKHLLLESILDHRKDNTALSKSEGTYKTETGQYRKKRTTRGWEFLVQWKDGSTDWIPLSVLKETNILELSEYAIKNHLQEEPAFAWWLPTILKRKKRIVAKMKSKYWKTNEKFGITLPHSVEEALEIDRKNGNNLWFNAIQKEIKNVRKAFREYLSDKVKTANDLRANPQALPGYQEIRCHMIFDIKMDGLFTRKARFVAGGHTTEPPTSITYSSVVSRESVRIAFLLASLLDLKALAADIGNAYINAPCREKIWCEAGPEFGSDLQGTVLIIERALYGLKSSAAAWRNMLAQTMVDLGFKSCYADNDVWLREQCKKDGSKYYEYVLIYVDDILCFSENPHKVMDQLSKLYRLKEGSIEKPKRYLGAQIEEFQLDDGRVVWAMNGRDYLTNAIRIVEKDLEESGGQILSHRYNTPMDTNYKPEIDITPLLPVKLISKYQSYIGILRWAVELGRIDVLYEVMRLSSFNAQPREGHFKAVLRIFSYLKKHLNSRLVLDDKPIMVSPHMFQPDFNWDDFYPEASEEKCPPHMPLPRGPAVTHTVYVDADHAGNILTRRSHTGIIHFINNAPVLWYSKRQTTVESSTFGSEFNALRIAVDQTVSMRYKLRMMGVRVDGPTFILCDNRAVVMNSSRPESTLKKKHNQICFHRVREAVAAGICKVGFVDGKDNLADLLTKTLTWVKRKRILSELLW